MAELAYKEPKAPDGRLSRSGKLQRFILTCQGRHIERNVVSADMNLLKLMRRIKKRNFIKKEYEENLEIKL